MDYSTCAGEDLASVTYQYDDASQRLLGITAADPNGNSLFSAYYKYSPAGDIEAVKSIQNGSEHTYTYVYDRLHRLTGEFGAGGSTSTPPSILEFHYDEGMPVHAPCSIKLNGTRYYFEYNANGARTGDWNIRDVLRPLQRIITYDTEGRPARIVNNENGSTTTFFYDGNGDRARKLTSSGESISYIGDHFEIHDGKPVKYLFAGDLRFAKITDNKTFFYIKDHLGSTRVILDEGGNQAGSISYLPFGGERTRTGLHAAAYTYTDQEKDPSTGLYNYDFRLYDPWLRQFVSPDSIVPDWYNPQSLNRYSYVLNNPLNYVDPDGHFVVAAAFAVAQVVAMAVSYIGCKIAANSIRFFGDTEAVDNANAGVNFALKETAKINASEVAGMAAGEAAGALISTAWRAGGRLTGKGSQLAGEMGGEVAPKSGRNYLQDIFSIKRQKGLGDIAAGTKADAETIGHAWVNGKNVKRFDLGDGGYGLTDGTRSFRLQYKPKDGVWKANFQENTFVPGRQKGIEVKNVHMTITDMIAP